MEKKVYNPKKKYHIFLDNCRFHKTNAILNLINNKKINTYFNAPKTP